MLIVSGTTVNAGCDWITITETTEKAQQPTMAALWKQSTAGLETNETNWAGYRGLSAEDIRWGKRDRKGKTDWILSVSGEKADEFVRSMGSEMVSSTRCTRLDLQVTVRLLSADTDVAKRYFGEMKNSESYRRGMVGRRAITLYDSMNGQTLYIGKRASKGFLVRIYDKSEAYGEDTGSVWRFEIEFKRDVAQDVLDALTRSSSNDTVEAIVTTTLEEQCGVVLPRVEGRFSKVSPKARPKETMEWLRACVRPVVVHQVNNGKTDEVLKALGLSWVVESEVHKKRKLIPKKVTGI